MIEIKHFKKHLNNIPQKDWKLLFDLILSKLYLYFLVINDLINHFALYIKFIFYFIYFEVYN